MKLVKKTFDTVLGLCLDGVQVAEASDQDVLDAYAQIPKDVRELDASMRAAKGGGHKVERPVLVNPDLTVLPRCAPGHEKAIEAFQNSLDRALEVGRALGAEHNEGTLDAAKRVVAERDGLRHRLSELEARESAWKERIVEIEEREAAL